MNFAVFGPDLPPDTPGVPPAVAWTPRSPGVPIPRAVRIHLRIHRLLIREVTLLLIALVLVVGLLRAYVETPADQRIGHNVPNVIASYFLHEFVWR